MKPILTAIPEELKARPQWVAWKAVERNGKRTKVPIDAKTGGPAKSNDPATWAEYERALKHYRAHRDNGIGFVFAVTDPYAAIDIDHALVDGSPRLCAEMLLWHLKTYSEFSPSQKGIHVILKGKLPPGGNRRTLPCGIGIELYDRNRFFTMTGHHLPETPTTIEDRQAELEALHRLLFGPQEGIRPESPRPGPTTPPDLDDAELIRKALEAQDGGKFAKLWAGDWQGAGYPSQSQADLALAMKLAFWCGPDPERIERLFSQSGLGQRDKWTKRPDYRERTIREALARNTEFYNPGKGTDPGADQNQDGGQTAQEREKAPGGNRSGQKAQEAPRSGPQAPTPSASSIPAWPHEVMAGAAGAFARTYANYLETPEAFLFMSYLTFLGHVISDRIALQSELTPPPRLYTILLGESAEARKTTSISQSLCFYHATLTPEILNPILGVGSAEGLAKCLKKNHRAILVLDELKSLIQKMRIDTSVLLPCLNTLFESKRFHSYTKKHDIEIDDAELCMLAASTLETYRNMFNSTFLDIGFINRLFIVIGNSERKFSIPAMIPQAVKDSLKSDLKEVLAFVGQLSQNGCYAMPLNSTARDIFDAWYFGLEQSAFSKRLDTYGHRLMPLLAINEMQDVITPEIAEKTVALLNYQLLARKFADPIDADNAIAKIEERIRRLLANGPLSKRELERRGSKNRVGIWAWEQAIKNLRNAGEISWDHRAREYRLNG